MGNYFSQEIIISLVIVVLLMLFLNPFGFWMPNVMLMMMIVGLIVAFSIFASFVWRENARDEREGMHKMMAGRIAFLAGTAVLVFGVIMQSLSHTLDIWLVFALGAMILAKIAGLIYAKERY